MEGKEARNTLLLFRLRLTWRRGVGWRGTLREGQAEVERCAHSLGRLEPDISSMFRDQFSAQIKAQTGSTDPLGLPIGRANKPAKALCLPSLWNTNALIGNTDEGLLPIWGHKQGHVDRPTVRAVFDGIGKQIDQHLLDAPPSTSMCRSDKDVESVR